MEYITLIGLAAGTLTTISFLPQAIKTIRSKHTKDLSLGMYGIFTLGVFLWLLYGLFLKDLPMIFANSIIPILNRKRT